MPTFNRPWLPVSEDTGDATRAWVEHALQVGSPTILRRGILSWPAAKDWTLLRLAEIAIGASVTLQLGNVERDPTRHIDSDLDQFLRTLAEIEEEGDRPIADIRYLAQFDLLHAFPFLQKDLCFRNLFPKRFTLYNYAWIGPRGTMTGLHRDDSNNLFGQILGTKRVVLVSPDQTGHLYPSAKYDYGAELSRVDLEDADFRRYPLLRDIQANEVIVEAGDLLFIPVGWWHQVRSLERSISVACFGQSYWERIRGWPSDFLWALHCRGLFRPRQGCVCHPVANLE